MPNITLTETKLITVCFKAVLEPEYGFQYFIVMLKLSIFCKSWIND
jgi:hypothetical protein